MVIVRYFNGLGGLSAGPYVTSFDSLDEALQTIEKEAFCEDPAGEIRETGQYSYFEIYKRQGNRWRLYNKNFRDEARPVLMPASFDPTEL